MPQTVLYNILSFDGSASVRNLNFIFPCLAGNVTFVELFEDDSGKSMGCGLVEYSTPEEAKKAIESLNDSKVNGREIKVKAVSKSSFVSLTAFCLRQKISLCPFESKHTIKSQCFITSFYLQDEIRFYPKVPDPMGPPPPMGGHGHGPGPMPMGPGPMHHMDMGPPPPMQQQAVSNVVFVSNVS